MKTIKLIFKTPARQQKKGMLLFQINFNNTTCHIKTDFSLYTDEWDEKNNAIIIPEHSNPSRLKYLATVQNVIGWEKKRFYCIVDYCDETALTLDEAIKIFTGKTEDGKGLFEYIRKNAIRLKSLGRYRCCETMEATLMSFMRFRKGLDISLDRLTANIIEKYEAHLKFYGLTRNTSSFYMRNLRSAYKQAIYDGLTIDRQPFCRVYTGVDKTIKRAISLNDMRKLKALDLRRKPTLAYAKDMLLFSFYTRGMSFIDMAYLRKKDIVNGYIIYRRKKTGQLLSIKITTEIQEIISKYHNETQYLLPIITSGSKDERRQYKNSLMLVNRHLKKIGEMAEIDIPLSTYVMRHTWASIARDKGIELSVISAGLGHENETTTSIYLKSISAAKIDQANRSILDDL